MLIKYNNFMLDCFSFKDFKVWNFTTLCLNNYGSHLILYDQFESTITIALNERYAFLFHILIFEERWFHLYYNNNYIIDFEDEEFIDNIYQYLIKIKEIVKNANKI